jgi:hypothetical protein
MAFIMVPSATLAPFSLTVPWKRQGGSVLSVGTGVGIGVGDGVGVGATVGSGVGSAVAVGDGSGVGVGDSPSPQPITVRAIARINRGTNMTDNFFISSPFRLEMTVHHKHGGGLSVTDV